MGILSHAFICKIARKKSDLTCAMHGKKAISGVQGGKNVNKMYQTYKFSNAP